MAAATYFSPVSGSFATFSANCIFASARLCSMPEDLTSRAIGNASSSFLSNQINWHVLHRSRLTRRSSPRLANSLKAFPQLGQLLSDGVLSATAVRQSSLTISLFKCLLNTARLTAVPEQASHLHRSPAITIFELSNVLHVGQIKLLIFHTC
jgi:hypothetical protein